MGLAGTGSKTIVADKVFVPAHRAVPFAELTGATAPGMRAQQNPLYKQSFLSVLPITIVAPVLGMAEGALAEFLGAAKVRTTRGAVSGGNRRMAELTTVQLRVAEASALVDAARLMIFRDLDDAFTTAARGEGVSMDMRLRNRRDQAFCVRLLIQAIDALFLAAGGQSSLPRPSAAALLARRPRGGLAHQPELGCGRQHVRAVFAGPGAQGAILKAADTEGGQYLRQPILAQAGPEKSLSPTGRRAWTIGPKPGIWLWASSCQQTIIQFDRIG